MHDVFFVETKKSFKKMSLSSVRHFSLDSAATLVSVLSANIFKKNFLKTKVLIQNSIHFVYY